MARRIAVFSIAVSAGTAKTSPVTTDISFDPGPVTEVEIIIPDGHVGLTGVQLAQAGQAVIPEEDSTYIVGNDEVIHWPIDGFIDNGNWQVIAYNEGIVNHAFHLRFLIESSSLSVSTGGLVQPIAI